jgi:hypothetical protein
LLGQRLDPIAAGLETLPDLDCGGGSLCFLSGGQRHAARAPLSRIELLLGSARCLLRGVGRGLRLLQSFLGLARVLLALIGLSSRLARRFRQALILWLLIGPASSVAELLQLGLGLAPRALPIRGGLLQSPLRFTGLLIGFRRRLPGGV